VLEPETVAFLEPGCAVIAATVSDDGEPHAVRGWGMTVVSRETATLRLLIDSHDDVAIADLSTTGAIAITAGHVRTLQSMQLKGRVVRIEDGTDADRDRAAQHCDAFFGLVEEIDGTPRVLLERMIPLDYVAVVVEVAEWFDQTPGPGAGAPIVTSAP